jgi:hypothetical protein
MQLAGELALLAFAIALALSWLVGRLSPDLGTAISFIAQMGLRVFASAVLAWVAVRAAENGGVWIALAVVCAIAAAGTFLLTLVIFGGAFFGWRRDQLG